MKKGHKVAMFTTSNCPQYAAELTPGIQGYHWREISPEIGVKPGLLAILKMDELYRINGTIKMYRELDSFLSESKEKFDLIFTDFMAPGSVIAAKKHNIPALAQYMGVLFEKVSVRPPWYEVREVPVENPNVWSNKLTFKSDNVPKVPIFAGAARCCSGVCKSVDFGLLRFGGLASVHEYNQ